MADRRRTARAARAVADRIVEEAPLEVRVATTDRGRARLPSESVVEAVVDAAQEAVRNVAFHSGRDYVVVRVEVGEGGTLVVEVVDDGRGFGPEVQPGTGTRLSIVRVMTDVGGTATITSRPGAGTTVRLAWRPHDHSATALDEAEDRYDLTFLLVPNRTRLLRLAIAPGLLLSTYFALRTGFAHGDVGLQLGLLTVVVVLTVLTLSRLGHGPFRIAELAALVPLLAAVMALGLAAVPDGTVGGTESWIIGATAIPLALISLVASSATIVLLVSVSTSVTIVAISFDPAAGLTDAPMALLAPAALCAFSRALGGALRNRSAVARADDLHRLQAEEALAERDAVRRAREIHLARIRDDVVPLLRSVIDGTASPNDPLVRALASRLERNSRDDLFLANVLDRAGLDLLTSLRDNGIDVVVRVPGDDPSVDGCMDALAAVRPCLEVGMKVVVTLADAATVRPTISVQPPLETSTITSPLAAMRPVWVLTHSPAHSTLTPESARRHGTVGGRSDSPTRERTSP